MIIKAKHVEDELSGRLVLVDIATYRQATDSGRLGTVNCI